MADRVVETLTGIVKGAIDSAKRLLGIKSPSRVFFEIGINIGEGLVQGLARVKDAVTEASAGLGEGVVTGVGRELERARAAVGLLRDFASAIEQYLSIAERWSAVQRATKRDWAVLFDLIERVARGSISAVTSVARGIGKEGLEQASSALEATRTVIEVLNTVLDLAERIRRGLPRVTFDSLFEWLSAFAQNAVMTLDSVAQVLGTQALARARAVAEATKSLIDLATGLLALGERWADVSTEVRHIWDSAAGWFQETTQTAISMFATLAQDFGEEALKQAEHVAQVMKEVVDAMTGTLEAIRQFAMMIEQIQVADTLIDWFVRFSERAVQEMANAATKLGQALEEAQRAAKTVGDIVRVIEEALKILTEARANLVMPQPQALVGGEKGTTAAAQGSAQSVNVEVRVYLDEQELQAVIKQVLVEVLT
jgi:hypothetical protein